MLKPAVQVSNFFLEIILLIAVGAYGYGYAVSLPLRVGLAAAFVAIVILLWARFAAPRSRRRLPSPALAIFRAVLFLIAAFLLYRLGHARFACLIAAIAIITQIISCYTEK